MDWTLIKHRLAQEGRGSGFKYMGERNRDNQTQVRRMRELGLREVGSSQEDKEGGREDRTGQNRQN